MSVIVATNLTESSGQNEKVVNIKSREQVSGQPEEKGVGWEHNDDVLSTVKKIRR